MTFYCIKRIKGHPYLYRQTNYRVGGKVVSDSTGISRFRVWYDRDPAGRAGQEQAVALINGSGGLTADGFDWEATFPSPARGPVQIPETLTDPGEFSGEQLKWLRAQGLL